MLNLRTLSLVLIASSFASIGCIADMQEPNPFDAEDLEVPEETMGLQGGNGLIPWCFWDHGVQATERILANAAIANSTGNMPSMPSVPPACWKAIKDTVECALPPTMSVKNTNTGEIYTGWAGLAPGWRTGPLGATQRRWVTACVGQRLNAFGIEVTILEEANYSTMSNDPGDDALFPFDESTVWGDMFSSTMPLGGNSPAFYLNVCSEADLNKKCRNVAGELNYRICDTEVALCGMNYMGSCSSACVPNGPYWTCGGNAQTVRVQLQVGSCH